MLKLAAIFFAIWFALKPMPAVGHSGNDLLRDCKEAMPNIPRHQVDLKAAL